MGISILVSLSVNQEKYVLLNMKYLSVCCLWVTVVVSECANNVDMVERRHLKDTKMAELVKHCVEGTLEVNYTMRPDEFKNQQQTIGPIKALSLLLPILLTALLRHEPRAYYHNIP